MDKYTPSPSISPLKYALKHLRRYRTKLAFAILWSILFYVIPMQIPVITGTLIDGLNLEDNEIGDVVNTLTGDTTINTRNNSDTVDNNNNNNNSSTNFDNNNNNTNSYSVNPFLLYGLINIGKTPIQVLYFSVVSLILVAIGYGLTSFLRTSSASILSRNFVFELQRSLIQKLEFLSVDVHSKYGSGDLLNRTIVDTNSLRAFVENSVIKIATNVVRLSYPILMLFIIDPYLALIACPILPVQLFVIRKLQSKVRKVARQIRNDRAKLTTLLKESLDGVETIQTSNAETYSIQKISKQIEKVEGAQVKSQRYYGMMVGFAWGLTSLGIALTWWLGGLKVISGNMTIGQLLIFTSFVLFAYSPIRRYTQAMRYHHRGLVAMRHVQEILEKPSSVKEYENAVPLKIFQGRIVFRDVCFSFNNMRNEAILEKVDINVEPMSLTAIVGNSGSGKSSVLKLITRLYDPLTGQVLIDGQDIKNVSIQSLRSQIGVVPQSPVVFSGTIMENIKLANPDASEAEVKEAYLNADASMFIRKFKARLNTVIGQGGIHLSPGEIQRIAIARALLKKPKILLLDEPLSSLDPESAGAIMDTMNKLKKDMTIILVARNRAEIDKVDNMITMDNGQVAEIIENGITKQLIDFNSGSHIVCSKDGLNYLYIPSFSYRMDALGSTETPKAESIALTKKETADLFEYKMIGRSANQRRINVIIIGEKINPELKIFIMAGQHGDESWSRKATERLISNLLKTRAKEFPHMCIAVLSDANPDGSRKDTRRTRKGLDMNRDHLRLKSPEVRAVHSFVRSWKPNLIVDFHNYPATRDYLTERNYVYCHDILIDIPTNLAIRKTLEQGELENLIREVQLDLEPHNYSCARYALVHRKGKVRNSTYDIIDARNYLALRYDTLTILLEAKEPVAKDAKEEIERTISSGYLALLSVLKWAKAHTSYLSNDSNTLAYREGEKIAIRSRNKPSDEPYRMNFENTLTKEIEEVTLPINISSILPTRYVELPSAYAIPVHKNRLIELLHSHGFISERIDNSKLEKVEKYLILSCEPPKKKNDLPSHAAVIVTEDEQDINNYVIFPVNQEGGHSLALLLEPQSKFGLHRYGYLDLEVAPGSEYPILRCNFGYQINKNPAPMIKEMIEE